jgi:hypothetical protein
MANSTFYSGFPVPTGMDFSPNRPGIFGRNIKLNFSPKDFSSAFTPAKKDSAFVPTPLSTGVEGTSSTEGAYPELEQQLAFERKYFPIYLEKMKAAAELQAQISQRQLVESYPILSAAADESSRRNLRASLDFLTAKEQMPSSVQKISESKQGQATSAAAGEAERARAVAAQQDAANRYGGQVIRFAGQVG